MEQPFIYKYQPLLLLDFKMEERLMLLLKTLITMDTLNILFVGDSGSGKTSFINAMIREYYNIIECDKELQNNILTINSLKEQGITYYRTEVKTFCQTSSSIKGKKKIIIIDDLDTINEQGQQVFRNYIDKYSNNVHFITSCCNTQKVIDSIQSRMTIIKIKQPCVNGFYNILHNITAAENIVITTEAEKLIISICNNSVRTLINYLEKFKLLGKEITSELVEDICTNITFRDFITYTTMYKNQRDLTGAIHLILRLFDRGFSVMDILDSYFLFIKITDILTDNEKYKIIPVICKYITIFSTIHEDEIELALFTNNLFMLFS